MLPTQSPASDSTLPGWTQTRFTPRAEAAQAERVARVEPRAPQDPSISCVVPAFDEADNLAQLVPRLRETLAACARDWEVIVVDDGSTDRTPRLLAALAQQPGTRVIRLSRNFGKEAALTAGLEDAAGDVVVMLDADLQHPPELIPRLLEEWQRGADIAYAMRNDRADESAFRRAATACFYRLLNLGDRFEVPSGAGDFRLMDRSVVDALLRLPERNRFMKGLCGWVGFETAAVPYQPAPRAHGRSRFTPLRLLGLSMDALTAFSTWPLRAVSTVGILLALMSFLYGGYLVLSHAIYGNPVSGWTTIVVSLMLFAGIQLTSLGIVAEYIGRVFEEVKARPLYVVKQRLGSGLPRRSP
jgi:glycosyltransferase involved in cell wall biosynthesis